VKWRCVLVVFDIVYDTNLEMRDDGEIWEWMWLYVKGPIYLLMTYHIIVLRLQGVLSRGSCMCKQVQARCHISDPDAAEIRGHIVNHSVIAEATNPHCPG
jgi:hypothetical protein